MACPPPATTCYAEEHSRDRQQNYLSLALDIFLLTGIFDLALHPSSDLALAPFQSMDSSFQKASEMMDGPQTPFQAHCVVEKQSSVSYRLTSEHASELTQAGCISTDKQHPFIHVSVSLD